MTGPRPPVHPRSMELRRVLRGQEPEIESIALVASRPVASTFQAVRIVHPTFPAEPGSLSQISALDVIEHVQDEEAWLEALADLLAPGGEILIRVPVEGIMAWLDAPNIYRYVAEFTGRGEAPHETKPTGWHRHYRRREIIGLIEGCGLRITACSRVGAPLADLPHLVGLVVGDLVLGKSDVETRLIDIRDKADRKDRARPLGKLGTRWRVTAVKPA